MNDTVENVEVEDGGFEHVSTVMQPRTPVRWTPEDAANFISSAIRESQQPTILALKKRGVSKLVYVMTCLLFLLVLGGSLYYFAYYKEMQWSQREADLLERAKSAQGKYDSLLESTLTKTSQIADNVVDNAKVREQLQIAREQLGQREVELSKLKGLNTDLDKKFTESKAQLDASTVEGKKLQTELDLRKEEIANIEKIKLAYEEQIKKLEQRIELMKQADKQQKQEISILRERINTMQKMIGSLDDEAEKPVANPADKPAE